MMIKEMKIIVVRNIQHLLVWWDLGKQCRPRSGAAEGSIWSDAALFAYKNLYQKWNKSEKLHQTPLKFNMDSSSW